MTGKSKKKVTNSAGTQLVKEIVELKKKIDELENRDAEQKRIEDVLLDSEERLKILFEYAPGRQQSGGSTDRI